MTEQTGTTAPTNGKVYGLGSELEDIPGELRAYIQDKRPNGTDFKGYLYRLRRSPGASKPKRFYLEQMVNEFYDDDFGEEFIKSKYGGGEYIAVYAYKDKDGKKNSIHGETMVIEGPEKKSESKEALPESSPAPSQSAPGLPAFNVETITSIAAAVTPIVALLKELIPKPDMSIFQKMQEAELKGLADLRKEVRKKRIEMVDREIGELDEQPGDEHNMETRTAWPKWLEPYAPLIEEYADKLLGDGLLAKTLRKTVLKNDTFQGAWSDPNKKQAAVDALTEHFGDEFAEQLTDTFDRAMEN